MMMMINDCQLNKQAPADNPQFNVLVSKLGAVIHVPDQLVSKLGGVIQRDGEFNVGMFW